MKRQIKKKNKAIPKSLQGVLWSVNVKNLDVEKDKVYIIHQILSYGTLEQIRWLIGIYSKAEIKRVFKTCPMKVYSFPSFNFIKNIVLDLKDKSISSKDYVSSVY